MDPKRILDDLVADLGGDLSTWTVALPSTSGALVAKAVAVFVKSSLLQAGVASAVISIVTLEPMGSVSTLTSSGFVLTTVQVTLISFDVTVTPTFVMYEGRAGSWMTTPRATCVPVFVTTSV